MTVSLRAEIFAALGLFVLALLLRWPHLSQSLWLDEMTGFDEYVLPQQPWSKVIAPRPGDYVPNNHVLHTLLAKLVYRIGVGGDDPLPPREALLRLPALLAGCLLPVALVWPLRRASPALAVVIGLLAAAHPWLVAFSVEARGYSLELFLAVLATNLLPIALQRLRRPGSIGYAVTLAATICTIPLAVLLVPAHAVWALLQKGAWRPWLRSTLLAGGLTILMYLPMARAMVRYYQHPFPQTLTYTRLLDWTPRYALAGERLPRTVDPLQRHRDTLSDSIYWALPVLLMVIGTAFGWRVVPLRPLLVSFGGATVLSLLLPLLLPLMTEVRFADWAAVWFCLAAAAALGSGAHRYGRIAGAMGLAVLFAWQVRADVTMPANQPIREALSRADQIVPADARIVVIFLGARESVALYGDAFSRHALPMTAPDTASFQAAERRVVQQTGQLPWVVIFFEQQARDQDLAPSPVAGLWSELIRHYQLADPRLPARLAPAAVYRPRVNQITGQTAVGRG